MNDELHRMQMRCDARRSGHRRLAVAKEVKLEAEGGVSKRTSFYNLAQTPAVVLFRLISESSTCVCAGSNDLQYVDDLAQLFIVCLTVEIAV